MCTKCHVPKKINMMYNDAMKLVDEAKELIEEANEMFDIVGEFQKIQTKLDEQIQFKKNKEFLYENRFKSRFYYFRDANKHPRIAICVIYHEKSGVYCRGISLCSFSDNVEKEYGRDVAEDRAIKAFKTQTTNDKIITFVVTDKETGEGYDRIKTKEILQSIVNYTSECSLNFTNKSTFDCELTKFEKKLFEPKTKEVE